MDTMLWFFTSYTSNLFSWFMNFTMYFMHFRVYFVICSVYSLPMGRYSSVKKLCPRLRWTYVGK